MRRGPDLSVLQRSDRAARAHRGILWAA